MLSDGRGDSEAAEAIVVMVVAVVQVSVGTWENMV